MLNTLRFGFHIVLKPKHEPKSFIMQIARRSWVLPACGISWLQIVNVQLIIT